MTDATGKKMGLEELARELNLALDIVHSAYHLMESSEENSQNNDVLLRDATSNLDWHEFHNKLSEFAGDDHEFDPHETIAHLRSTILSAISDAARVREKALEEAAREVLLIDREEGVECPSGPAWKWYGKSRDHAAARIRALTQAEPEGCKP